jgi:hypothetical protein
MPMPPLQVAPAPYQARRQVLKTGELDLHLALVALCASAEDLEDEHCSVGDGDSQMLLEIALLGRRQCLIEQHGFGLVELDHFFQLVGFA